MFDSAEVKFFSRHLTFLWKIINGAVKYFKKHVSGLIALSSKRYCHEDVFYFLSLAFIYTVTFNHDLQLPTIIIEFLLYFAYSLYGLLTYNWSRTALLT